MSKASEWAKRHEAFVADNAPTLRDEEDEVIAEVDEYGDLRIERPGRTWTAAGSLALARWILDTFGEEKT